MILNRGNLNDLFTGFNVSFRDGFGAYAAMWNMIAMLSPSSGADEHYAWLGQFPGLREWLGKRHIKQIKSHDYRIKNKSYESTVEVDRDDISDDKYGVYSPLVTELGRSSAAHPDELVFGLLKAGFASLCYDGQFFFDTDHPVGRETVVSVSNSGGGSGTPWFLLDTSRMIKPIIFQERKKPEFVQLNKPDDDHVFKTKKFLYGVDNRCNVGFGLWQLAYGSKQTLDEAAFNAAYAGMEAIKGDEGRPLGIKPTHLVVPPALRSTALNLVKEKLADGSDNPNAGLVKVLSTAWLS